MALSFYWLRHFVAAFCLIAYCTTAHSENRALLIGATSYEKELFNLSGIDKDLTTMKQFARLLGYQDGQIKTLAGPDVTKDNVQTTFTSFLSDGVGPTDSILIYYSGHGVQVRDINNDESDGRDEALTMHNLALERTGGYSGIITDDQLQVMLDKLPSRNIILIVDACHSGTVTRSLTTEVQLTTLAYGDAYQIKALPYRGQPTSSSRTLGQPINIRTDGIIALSAAQDDEQALATTMGSTFTLSLFSALQEFRKKATPQALIEFSKSSIRDKIDAESVFTPNISGDLSLANRPFNVTNAEDRGEIYWQQLEDVARQSTRFEVSGINKRYTQDEEIALTLNLPFDGYVNILLVDSQDNAVVLYPNSFDTDNFHPKGLHEMPASGEYGWYAQAPWGKNLLVALHSEKPLNLTTDNLNQDTDGVAVLPFIAPSPVDMEKLASAFIQPGSGLSSATTRYFETCENDHSCWK